MVKCPVCDEDTTPAMINYHLDKGCPSTRKKPRLGEATSSPVPSSPKSPHSTPFSSRPPAHDVRPLAEVMRPKSLDKYVGQQHLVGPDGVLRKLIERDRVPSIILWGPSGVGKTSFARLVSSVTKSRFIELSATTAGTSDVKKVVDEAKKHYRLLKQRTILFLDEIHRFNRTQQDSLLPAMETGDIILIGATTENPSFKLQGALLSRSQVYTLNKLSVSEIHIMLVGALDYLGEQGQQLSDEILQHIAQHAQGDARVALNMLELASSLPASMDHESIKASLKTMANYDQKGENHYDFISAFHKSVRGSDANAALYYLARMLEGGEDPLYISRRMVRMASEDIGLVDDTCLPFAVATHTSVQQIGMPECDVILAHCAVKLARAAKDVEVYKAWGLVKSEVASVPGYRDAPIPMHLRNAPTKLMEELGYANGYKYNPRYVTEVDQKYLPEGIPGDWLGKWQPDKCDICGTDEQDTDQEPCEHLLGVLRDYD